MHIIGFPAGMFQTNCYIVVGEASRCVIVDPGQDAAPTIRDTLTRQSLIPEAVLLTHGHLDHVWNVCEVADHYNIPTLIHPEDRYMLTDPARGLSPQFAAHIKALSFQEPHEVVEVFDGETLDFAGLRFEVDHVPGHSAGSVAYTVQAPIAALPTDTDSSETHSANPVTVMFGGDVLFKDGVGRTDLPGGDHDVLLSSIGKKFFTRDDDTIVLPGHGPQTTIGAERTANPFVRALG